MLKKISNRKRESSCLERPFQEDLKDEWINVEKGFTLYLKHNFQRFAKFEGSNMPHIINLFKVIHYYCSLAIS